MRAGLTIALALCALACCALPAAAQAPRQDAIWARSTAGATITLDGVLDEPAWALAESTTIRWAVDNGIPGSGYKGEGGWNPTDPTRVTVKFLADVADTQLYVAFTVPDSSIGGGVDFNRFDGFLMGLKDHSNPDAHPAPVAEYFYVWWDGGDTLGTKLPGALPVFLGRWGGKFPRTPEMVAAWNAGIKVRGLTNSDAAADTGYTVEMRFDLGVMGYDLDRPEGDIVEWNCSVYDCDWFWPIDFYRFSASRSWWQDAWGNVSWFSEARIHSRPDVTIASGPVPFILPEVYIPNAANFAAPVIDGFLDEPVYLCADSVRIKFNDNALRDTYGNPGKFRAGQYQPPVNGGEALVTNPGDATVYYFFKNDSLYLGFDVRDRYVQYHALRDRWDGFVVSFNDRVLRAPDNNLLGERLSFIVGDLGQVVPMDSLPRMISIGAARVALQLKAGTTVDTVASGVDAGWTAEMILDLTKFHYPPGRGDGTVFLGVDLYDGDSFTNITQSYGTRTWWWREHEAYCCPPWGYLDPARVLVDVGDEVPRTGGFAVLGNYPNPYRSGTTIRYALPVASDVTFEVYDVRGRLVAKQALGVQQAGVQQVDFERAGTSGVHFYRLRMVDPKTGASQTTLSGKMMLLE